MATLDLKLHPKQLEVYEHKARFKVIAAGRRWGKSRLAAVEILTKALQDKGRVNGYDVPLQNMEVWYVAPTFDQAKDIIWGLLKNLAKDIIVKTWENDGRIKLVNGRSIQIKGSDRPDRLRGVGLSHVVLDEFASMKPDTWDVILRPTLADVAGSATFIGTPLGKNHFYDLWMLAQSRRQKLWHAWHFESKDNPYLPREEIRMAKETMPREVFKQEFEASFEQSGRLIFDTDLQVIEPELVPDEGNVYIAMDPAGFISEAQAKTRKGSRASQLDETAIAIVKVSPKGWYVLDIEKGRWDVRESSIRLLNACRKYHPLQVAIERGVQRNALMPYLEDQMRRLSVYPRISEVHHGGKDKATRVAWALQGRLEHGRIYFVQGEYLTDFKEQLYDFPNGRHDDMVDALAYIDQIASVTYREEWIQDSWEPLDQAVGL